MIRLMQLNSGMSLLNKAIATLHCAQHDSAIGFQIQLAELVVIHRY